MIYGATIEGVDATLIAVEVCERRLSGASVQGVPERVEREIKARVRCALAESDRAWPAHLGVAIVPEVQRAATLDLAVAAALTGTGSSWPHHLWFGELALSGEIRAARGLIPALLAAADAGIHSAVIPSCQEHEARLALSFPALSRIEVYHARTLSEVLGGELDRVYPTPVQVAVDPSCDWADIHGHEAAKAAIEQAVIDDHSVLMIGPPGTGKTMLARRVPSIMPTLDATTAAEILRIQSAVGLPIGQPVRRPFRAPHHTASITTCIGGGIPLRPGEVTLAHGGVLFLDEAVEFHCDSAHRGFLANALAACKSGSVMLLAAANPCVCGPSGECRCSPAVLASYQARLAEIAAMFDVVIEVPRATPMWHGKASERGETSATVRARVEAAKGIRA